MYTYMYLYTLLLKKINLFDHYFILIAYMYTYPYIIKKRRKKNVYFFFWKTSFDPPPPYRGVSVQNSEFNILMIKEKKIFFIKRGIQSGGFLQFIIPAIISAIGGIISSVISSKSKENQE